VVKRKLSKRAIIGILAVIVSILLVAIVVILFNKFKIKTYDVNKLKESLINGYEELYLSEMDHVDVLSLYGFEKNEVEDALYLKSLKLDDEGNDITENVNYIIIMNTDNYQYYYEIFESHIDSTKMYTEDKKLLKLYDKNAILKKDKNYVYLIISKKSKEIEEFIN
jgi:hypothetical protein